MRPAHTDVLLVESEPDRAGRLLEQLLADGYRARHARSAEHARVLGAEHHPDVVLLGGLDSPGAPFELLRQIRDGGPPGAAWSSYLPAIVLGRAADEHELLRAFEAGADDYLARPVRYLELRVRLRALLARRAALERARWLCVGPLCIDTRARRVILDGRELELRRLEYELLVCLAGDPLRVFERHELLATVWGYRSPGATRTLDSHASRLRRKLDPDRSRGWVVAVRGVGYRLT